jgi:hypothetical protein
VVISRIQLHNPLVRFPDRIRFSRRSRRKSIGSSRGFIGIVRCEVGNPASVGSKLDAHNLCLVCNSKPGPECRPLLASQWRPGEKFWMDVPSALQIAFRGNHDAQPDSHPEPFAEHGHAWWAVIPSRRCRQTSSVCSFERVDASPQLFIWSVTGGQIRM